MSISRTVRWVDKQPLRHEIGMMLADYVRGIGTVRSRRHCWFDVTLAGGQSWTFERVGPVTPVYRAALREQKKEGLSRHIEVYVNETEKPHYIDVITRHGDHITEAIAAGFAERIAGLYGTKVTT